MHNFLPIISLVIPVIHVFLSPGPWFVVWMTDLFVNLIYLYANKWAFIFIWFSTFTSYNHWLSIRDEGFITTQYNFLVAISKHDLSSVWKIYNGLYSSPSFSLLLFLLIVLNRDQTSSSDNSATICLSWSEVHNIIINNVNGHRMAVNNRQ